jgi:predicted GNAT family N-acyltransferase
MTKLNNKFVESDDELKQAFQVRRLVFVEEQGISEEIELDDYDREALHMVVQYGKRIIGTARVISFINGKLMSRRISRVIIHAQCSAIPFYKSCGFIESGGLFYEAGIPHVKMEIQL